MGKQMAKEMLENRQDNFKLTYAQIEEILGFPIDHSFLKYKKELLEWFDCTAFLEDGDDYGYDDCDDYLECEECPYWSEGDEWEE